MKKILVLLLLSLSFGSFLFTNVSASKDCLYDFEGANVEVGKALNDCLKGSALVNGKDVSVKAGGGFVLQIKSWVDNIALYLGIFAVGSIVFGSLMMTLSAGEEEKIKKAKDIVKWGIIGFIALISVSAIINLVVKIMYSI